MASSSSSATTAASRAGAAALLALLAAACPRYEVGVLPGAETAEPQVRVGLGGPAPNLSIGGGEPLLISGPDGGGITLLPEGTTATVAGDGASVEARIGGSGTQAATALTVRPASPTGFVRVNGRDYRGELLVTSTPTGVLAVNLVSLEGYVAGVVNAEMGRRPPGDSQAVFAQAVISRTVAMRALGRYRVRGYDLVSTVSDQAYGGVASETDAGWNAVRVTRGEVLTYGGAVIEAFFHSTCGGRTEAVDAVFSGAAQPYLQSINDRAPSGEAYCSISPRFRWQEEWSGEELSRTLAATPPW
ncbi:MAG: SpoIID/LytB domain-containing protein [Gemmatimonadales bacterium]